MADNPKPINSPKALPTGNQPATSEKKIEANRLNAKKSTGPRTDASKNRTRFNALKDGLHAKSLCVLGESLKAVDGRLQRLADEFNPEDEVQWQYIFLIAQTLQWLDRCIRAQGRRLGKIVKEEASYANTIAKSESKSPEAKAEIYTEDIDAGVLRYFDEEPCKSLDKNLSGLIKRLDRLVRALLELQQRSRK